MFKFSSPTKGNWISHHLPLLASSLLSEVSPSTEPLHPQLHRDLLNRTFHTRVKLCKTSNSRSLTDFNRCSSQHKLIITCLNKYLQVIYKVSHLHSNMECSKIQWTIRTSLRCIHSLRYPNSIRGSSKCLLRCTINSQPKCCPRFTLSNPNLSPL